MTMTICMCCGHSWNNENVYGYRFCDGCFEKMGRDADFDDAERVYAKLNPEWKLWWDKFEKEEMD